MHNRFFIEKSVKNGASRTSSKKYITVFGTEILVQGTLEEAFVKKCESENIFIKNGPVIDYLYKDKKRKYFIDFEIEYLGQKFLIEIKSLYWYNKLKEQVLAKEIAAKDFVDKNKDYRSYCLLIDTLEIPKFEENK
jgi:hypothetical protein